MKLSDIRPNVYPIDILTECDSGLCLFGAGFYGRNDAIHMYNAGIKRCTVLDIDEKKIHDMIEMYPISWVIQPTDVLRWVPNTANSGLLTWDIVSVDAPTNLFEWVRDNFDDLVKLTNKYLVITMYDDMAHSVAYFCDNLDVELVDQVNRSLSSLISLFVFKRVAG